MTEEKEVRPFTWIVRFDVHPQWVADGGNISDLDALNMLSNRFGWADVNTELAACVLAAPMRSRIAQQQGYNANYEPNRLARLNLYKELADDAPVAYGQDRFSLVRIVRDLEEAAQDADQPAILEGLKTIRKALTGQTPIGDVFHLPGAADEEATE